MSETKLRVCFVCLGNICRSPTAEGVMKQLVQEAGLSHRFSIESAGTAAAHAGEAADPRSRAAAQRRGVLLTSRARRFLASDLDDFDYVVAMDRSNFSNILRLSSQKHHHEKVALLRSFDPRSVDAPGSLDSAGPLELDVPDPYYEDNFDAVFDICLAGCRGLLAHITKQHGLWP